ncbi:MAG: DinB family protein [Phycisphaerales bacterium]
MSLPQPPIDEFRAISNADLIARYSIGVENFDRRIFELTDEQLDMAWLPSAGVGRWPVRVLLGHLADAELAFVMRMRQVVAEERPTFAVWDENALIESGLYQGADGRQGPKHPIGAFVAVIHTLRKWHGPWLATLSEEQFRRKALHPERGEQTARIVLEYAAWHLEHHAWYLRAKVERLLGSPAPAGRGSTAG